MIIGVSGKAGAGKDVFSNIAVNEFGAEKLAFAGGLKEEVAEFLTRQEFPFEMRNLYGTQADKEEILSIPMATMYDKLGMVDPPRKMFRDFIFDNAKLSGCMCGKCSPQIAKISYRQLLQWWGTEYRRAGNENYWVDKALKKCVDPSKIYVISDCRFKNEANGILDNGGKVVRIERNQVIEVSNMNHPSEIDLDDFDRFTVTIRNNWTLEEYENICRGVLKRLVNGDL